MSQNSNADMLVGCLLRSPELRRRALAAAGKLALFDTVKHPEHAALWAAIQKMNAFLDDDEPVPLLHLRKELEDSLAREPRKEILEAALALAEGCDAIDPAEIKAEIGMAYLEPFQVAAEKAAMMSKLERAFTRDDLLKMINASAESLENKGESEVNVIETPLMDPVRFMPTSIRYPMGVRWIDQLSFGGHCDGEVVGVLGPTGGGKTLTATQMQMSQALMKNHSLLVLYEQSLEGDVSERLYCQLFGDKDLDFFRNTSPRDWPAEDKARYRELREDFGKYVHVLDFAKGRQGMNGVRDIADAVQVLAEAGRAPRLLIIDWLWPAVRRYCIAHDIGLEKMRAWASAFIDDLKQLTVRTEGMTSVLFHQLNTDTSRASPARIPTVTDAYELRDFSYMLDACYVIGNRDRESNVMWLATDKNRRGAPQAILGKMHGARGRIDPAEGMVYDAREGFVPAEADDESGEMPPVRHAPDDYR